MTAVAMLFISALPGAAQTPTSQQPGSEPAPVATQRGAAPESERSIANLPPLESGQRVRVRSPRLAHWEATGQVLSVTEAGLALDSGDGASVELAWDELEWIRVDEGSRGAYWEGALIGLLTGLVVAEGIVAADRDNGQVDPDCGLSECYDPGFWVAMGAVRAGAGAAVGGLLFRRTRWQTVPLPSGTNVRAAADVAWTGQRAELRFRVAY